MTGYGDPEKMRAAIELAQSFGKTKAPREKKRVGGGSLGPKQEHWEPYQMGQQSRYGQVSAPPRQTFSSFGSYIPPPSQRNYGPSVNFSTGRARRPPVIGKLGLDFLNAPRSTVESSASEKAQMDQESATTLVQKSEIRKENGSNSETTMPGPISTLPRSSGNGQCENILDAFYSILAKKPSLGQEIETLTEILPKAMDLNATGKAAPNVSPINKEINPGGCRCTCRELDGQGVHGKTCPLYKAPERNIDSVDEKRSNGGVAVGELNNTSQSSGVEVKSNNGSAYSHSRKLSPVAPVFVPNNKDVPAITKGEHQDPIKNSTKGLKASMWA
ncbi:hypothetical protein TARUN_5886 [Trichoderma arundinaceum]|uniref:Uncharacterized protein n=1 Tax=Trichoderma arundinaceum TaxID=490622 RepID=A0A395NJZ2_TRIAR|nr:hypothetical protein TARUN_5886 [Trichoderma arundinaceum]